MSATVQFIKQLPDKNPVLKIIGQQVIAKEAQSLTALSEFLGDSFERAIGILYELKGRIIVSGMGKSGIIARKIVSTLASTGQPALFIHPSEAGHGDLGMLKQQDAIILLSNSGETQEIGYLINYAKRFSIPLIGITSNPDSTLAHNSDEVLLLPPVAEACPMGLAPTCSTTMMLALGDAIAVTLLTLRGFTSEDFQVFHPSGSLGQKLLKVANCMHVGEKLPVISPDSSMSEALVIMSSKGFGCGIVCQDNKVLGVITDGDLRRHMGTDLLSKKAVDVMTPNPHTIKSEMLMSEALGVLNQFKITSLIVATEDSNLQGLIHIHDFFRLSLI